MLQDKACDLVGKTHNLFSSPQCLGYSNEFGDLTAQLCNPSLEEIVRQVQEAVKGVGAKSVYVASDHHHMEWELSAALGTGIKVTKAPPGTGSPQLDLYMLGRSNHFVGNCVSSFSAFVKRERDAMGFPSTFFGYPSDKRRHDEL